MKLYDFDGVDERLELMPLAARRALDHAGCKLSLDGWLSLPLDARRKIADAGSGEAVQVEVVTDEVQAADPAPEPMPPERDPGEREVPTEVLEAFGEQRPLPDVVWQGLSAFDRYALLKVARSGRAARIASAYGELVGHTAVSTHLAPKGGIRMVDVAQKQPTKRSATVESQVVMNRAALERLLRSDVPKGDVLATARLAGVMAAKRTAELIPLCHPVAMTHVSIQLEIAESARTVQVLATVEAFDRTGVEMEAMVAASMSALTIYDMLKAFDRDMTVGPTRLMSKSGGRSGDFQR